MQKPLDTNLPADLPENWQIGDAVTPQGTDANLSEKHGYNYQSKQINDAQKAINDLNDAFEGVQEDIQALELMSSIEHAATIPVITTMSVKKRVKFITMLHEIRDTISSLFASAKHKHGNIDDTGHIGTEANQAVHTTTGGQLIAGTLPVAAGGTGKTSFTSGQVLVGNGTEAVTQKAIDSTRGGTSGSEALITSGAVRAALAAGDVASAPKLATPRTIALSGGVTGTATSFDGSANITIPVTAVNPANLSTVVPVNKGGTGVTNLNVDKLKKDSNADTFTNIYLSPNGNDTATGLTESVPMRSIRAAVVKYGGLNRIRLNLAAGTYTDTAELAISGNVYIDITGTPTTAGSVVITHPIIFQSNDAKLYRVTFDLTAYSGTYPCVTLRQSKYDIQECVFKGKSTVHAGINVSLGSSGYIYRCTFQTGIRGVEIGAGAVMTALECTIASDFDIGFNVNGGMLISGGNTNNAETKFTMYNSAAIFNDGTLLNQSSGVVATATAVEYV